MNGEHNHAREEVDCPQVRRLAVKDQVETPGSTMAEFDSLLSALVGGELALPQTIQVLQQR